MKDDSLTGPSYTAFSSKADCQKSVNLYREEVTSGQGISQTVMLRSPGLLPDFINPATHISRFKVGPVRCMLNREPPAKEHAFINVDDTIYDVQDGVIDATYGPIVADSSPSIMAESPTSLMIASAGHLYRINGGALTEIIPGPGLGVKSVRFIKNSFVVLYDDLQQFGWSENDGLTFPAGNVQTFEADANNALNLAVINQLLWVIGTRITQVYSVGANPNAPFVPIDSGVINSGTIAAHSVTMLGDSLLWLERMKEGLGSFVMTNGFSAVPISNPAVANAIRGYAKDFGISDAIGMSYLMNDQEYAVWTFPGADKSWQYNKSLNEWNELSHRNYLLGTDQRHRAMCMMAAFGKILVGDHSNGIVYEMSPDIYHDGGFPLRVLRRTPHLIEENKNIDFKRLELACETGVGLASPLWLHTYNMQRAAFVTALADAVTATTVTADQAIVLQQIYDAEPYIPLDPYPAPDVMVDLGFTPWGAALYVSSTLYGSAPMITYRYSNDGGKTFKSDLNRSLGASGDYEKRVFWDRLGMGRDRVGELEYSAPCKLAINSSFLEAEALAG